MYLPIRRAVLGATVAVGVIAIALGTTVLTAPDSSTGTAGAEEIADLVIADDTAVEADTEPAGDDVIVSDAGDNPAPDAPPDVPALEEPQAVEPDLSLDIRGDDMLRAYGSEPDTWVQNTVKRLNDPGRFDADQLRAFDPNAGAYDPWLPVRLCESGDNYAINTGNGFYGAYQFTIGTWNWVGGMVMPAYVGIRPDLAPPWVQDRMADALAFEVAGGGLHHWPVCGRRYGT